MDSCFLMLVMMLYRHGVFEMQKGIAVLACLFLCAYCFRKVETCYS